MITARRAVTGLIERLPPVAGRYTPEAPLAPVTWFRVGGSAEVMFRPADVDDLRHFLASKPAEVPVTVIGVGSNLLVRDGGVPGVVVRLGKGFAPISSADGAIRAGAGALALNVALTAAEAGLGGLEFFSGVPGTVGGAVRMNAGAYGVEVKDVLVTAEALDGRGERHGLGPSELGLAYRRSALRDDWIVVAATFRGRPDDPTAVRRRMSEIAQAREASQPLRTRTGGSTFKNPPGEKAWELIERAGCRGLRIGGAMVSEKHCNFLINTGDASAADVEALGKEVQRRVLARTGIALEWEIRRIGVCLPGGDAA
ncbi:MAG: UDP-N-acetylmuramate dehydrogenase [Alphaproteobacteria bacterium]|nr:UDP-N-acetylmuramate dehydrogenase [Alphaproteobacteria bacterium]